MCRMLCGTLSCASSCLDLWRSSRWWSTVASAAQQASWPAPAAAFQGHAQSSAGKQVPGSVMHAHTCRLSRHCRSNPGQRSKLPADFWQYGWLYCPVLEWRAGHPCCRTHGQEWKHVQLQHLQTPAARRRLRAAPWCWRRCRSSS